MQTRPKVLIVAAEAYPLAKTGGLADVVSALPQALARFDTDVRLLLPAYPSALDQLEAPRTVADLGTIAGAPVSLVAGRTSTGMPVYLVVSAPLYQRGGTPYSDDNGIDWPDNARRFGVLSHAAARVGLGNAGLDWQPDVVHCHDWHAGLTPLLIGFAPHPRPRTVFTIHNAAFAGKFGFDVLGGLDIPTAAMGVDGAEFYGSFSYLKAGIRYADKITTVSPTYAREICTPEFGCGFDGLLRARAGDLVGIMNGIDQELWNPASDVHLAQRYSRADCGGKDACKAQLQAELGLKVDANAPLAVFISRITPQKMADVVLDALPEMMGATPNLQFALLGRGDRDLEAGFQRAAQAYPGRASVRIDYSEQMAHRLHGGGDILVHGSRFEPCGLTQLYAMRYGTLPLVRRVGGLADSVADADAHDDTARGTGYVFDEASRGGLLGALRRCVATYQSSTQRWRQLQHNAMASDFSWRGSAQKYLGLYASEAAPLMQAA